MNQLALVFAARDEALTAVTEASDDQDIAVVDQAIDRFAASGVQFSANDIRPLLPPLRSNNLIGARFNAARMRRQIVKVGEVTSTDPGTHGKPVALYRGAAFVAVSSD
jgi:hypothetical protein